MNSGLRGMRGGMRTMMRGMRGMRGGLRGGLPTNTESDYDEGSE